MSALEEYAKLFVERPELRPANTERPDRLLRCNGNAEDWWWEGMNGYLDNGSALSICRMACIEKLLEAGMYVRRWRAERTTTAQPMGRP